MLREYEMNTHITDNFVLQAYHSGRLSLNQLKIELIRDIPPFLWGSSQYQEAAQMYVLLYYLREQFTDRSGSISDADMFEDMHFRLNLGEVYSFARIMHNLQPYGITGGNNLDEVVRQFKHRNFTLWETIRIIFECAFSNADIQGVQLSEGNGPLLNRIAQSENNLTGVKCFILRIRGLILYADTFSNFTP